MAETTDTPPAQGAASAADSVPDRPPWLRQQSSAKPRRGSSSRRQKPAGSIVVPREEHDPQPWKTRAVLWLTSAAATGYGLSLIFHSALLTVMACWILPGLLESNSVTTVVQSDTEIPEEFDDLLDVKLDSPAGDQDIVKPQITEMVEQDAEITRLQHDLLSDVTAAEAKGDGGSSAGSGGGFRLLEPKNAVRKGSFTAWTIPIAMRVGEKPKAGEAPRPGQPYYIVIQVKLQKGRRTYKINDLSGKIVGTDGYQQLIPGPAFVQESSGRLVRARLNRLLPIKDGVSQILIKVPGAEALVKDTIIVKSRSLKEQQILELVFGERQR